ncbi:MAG: hypothetical protein EP312_04935 [Gammaproteobacteria bacterium]|nr:MAG: hypothetical protein EP312_04935 [Gammaproteobacteria bacterium]
MKRLLILVLCCLTTPLWAATQRVELTMQYHRVALAGKPVQAITVNGQIPGPELRFREGDTVEIVVHNALEEPGAIHWHGLLVPWQMDGVPWVSMPPIAPGESFTYRFPLRQSGTYWYHAHSKLHEQQGLYGAFIVEPAQEHLTKQHSKTDRDITILLSDWSNTHPDTIYRNLKKDGDYYKSWRPNWQFFTRAWRDADEDKAMQEEILKQGKAMQTMRMGNWDWADVAYDSFLLNGTPPQHPFHSTVKAGERVRVRIINGGASTYFNIKLHGMDDFMVISADGQDVEPITAKRLLMGMAETYDIVFTAPQHPVALYAEALDRSGAAIGVLSPSVGYTVALADIPPFADPMFIPGSPDHGNHGNTASDNAKNGQAKTVHDMSHHDHHAMSHSMPESPTPLTHNGQLDYAQLRSVDKTHEPGNPLETITLNLTGNMERYIWSFNDIRFQDAQPIEFVKGKEYRFVLNNTTMMHHPIHIHGHWFVLENGQGAFSPRKHTIDVPPMQTITARVIAQESGKWFFHCHNLYHMMAGMTREIHYREAQP